MYYCYKCNFGSFLGSIQCNVCVKNWYFRKKRIFRVWLRKTKFNAFSKDPDDSKNRVKNPRRGQILSIPRVLNNDHIHSTLFSSNSNSSWHFGV